MRSQEKPLLPQLGSQHIHVLSYAAPQLRQQASWTYTTTPYLLLLPLRQLLVLLNEAVMLLPACRVIQQQLISCCMPARVASSKATKQLPRNCCWLCCDCHCRWRCCYLLSNLIMRLKHSTTV
jgi:hypothetical protein